METTLKNAVLKHFGNNRTYSYTTKVFDGYGLRIHTEVIVYYWDGERLPEFSRYTSHE